MPERGWAGMKNGELLEAAGSVPHRPRHLRDAYDPEGASHAHDPRCRGLAWRAPSTSERLMTML